MEFYFLLLEPFEEATTVLSAENYVIISLVHPVINALQRYLSAYITNSLTVSMVAKDIDVDIATRFSTPLLLIQMDLIKL